MADKVLVTEIYPYVERALSDKKNVNELEKLIGNYIDKNVDVLSAIGPTKMLYFSDKNRDPVYRIIGIDSQLVKKALNKSKDIKSSGRNMADPFNSLMCMIIRFFTIQKNAQMVHLSMLYLTLSMYPSIFKKYYKYEPNENIMNYTINNLSFRYKLKQTSNLMAAIDETGFGGYELHKNDLVNGADAAVVNVVLAIKTRLNSFMKKIRNEFEKNYREGNYLNKELEVNDDENFREAESSSYIISRIVDKVSLNLTLNGAPIKVIDMAAKANSVSVNELRNYINSLISDDEHADEIKSLIESILFLYLFDEKNNADDIVNNKFLLYCLEVYKKSNVTDKNIVKIKKILDGWLDRLGTYKKTQRIATINNFRRAIYTFFVMVIMYYSNR